MERIVLRDVCDIIDGPHATPTKTESGPVYLGIDAITEDGRLNEADFAHLSVEDYKKWTRRVTPTEGDIVFSYEATLGRYAVIPKGFFVSQFDIALFYHCIMHCRVNALMPEQML